MINERYAQRALPWWVAILSVLSACGGAAPATTTTAANATVDAVEPAAPPPITIPEDLWSLVPSDAMGVAELDLDLLRQWSQYATLQRWLTQYACVQDDERMQLLSRVQRALAALTLSGPNDVNGVLVLRGTFSDADAALIAREIRDDATKQTRDRFDVYVAGKDLVALLDARTLVIASGPWANIVLSIAGGGGDPTVRSAPFVQDLQPRFGADRAVLSVLASPAGGIAKDVLGDVARWGGHATAISKGLAAAAFWGARVTLDPDHAGVSATAITSGASEADAAALVEALRGAFWQAGLFMRLIGLPPILTNATLQQAEGVATLGLHASGPEAATLLARLEDAIKGEAEACVATPAIATSPTP